MIERYKKHKQLQYILAIRSDDQEKFSELVNESLACGEFFKLYEKIPQKLYLLGTDRIKNLLAKNKFKY
jgi:hypothetical protein